MAEGHHAGCRFAEIKFRRTAISRKRPIESL